MTTRPSPPHVSPLDAHESRWGKRGYTLVREPTEAQLPGFLHGARPDAIAVGRAPSLAIMLSTSNDHVRTDRLRRLLEGREDWRLEVIVELPDGPLFAPEHPGAVSDALARARTLADHDPAAGLLMAWAALEAGGRVLEPSLSRRRLSTGALIDLLVSNGHLEQEDGDRMRPLAELRNRVAHGQLEVRPTKDDVQAIVDLGKVLVSSEPASGFASA